MVLEICGRDRLIRLASSSCVQSKSVSICGVGRRLLERIELGPVQILQQRVAEQVVVLGLPHDGRNAFQPGLLAGPPPAFTHHQLVAVLAERSDDDRLEQPDLANRLDEFVQRVLVEHHPRLTRVGRDRA